MSTDAAIPSYEFVRALGQGGTSTVSLYRHQLLGRLAAVKFFREEAVGWDAFNAEAAALGALSGVPNVVEAYDAGLATTGAPYLIMHYYPGPSLQELASREVMSVHQVLDVAQKISAAVAAIHGRGVVHGDIKPQNIVTDEDGEPYLGDFGTAALFAGQGQRRAVTPAFAAPEALHGEQGPAALSDVYSTAATIWALLEGRPHRVSAGGDNTVLGILRRARDQRPPRSTRSDAPEPLRRLLARALSWNPADRPTSVELASELQALVLVPGSLEQPKPSSREATSDWGSISVPWGRTIFRSLLDVVVTRDMDLKGMPPLRGKNAATAPQAGIGSVVAVLTAIPDEMSAVTRHLRKRKSVTSRHGLLYTEGEFAGGGRRWRVICACIGPGNVSAALVTQQTVLAFEPALLAFVGVAGGIKDVERGDVVVASRVMGYEGGKETSAGFLPRPAVFATDFRVAQHFTHLSLSGRWRNRIPKEYRGVRNVLIKPIVAGEKVIATNRGQLVRDIRRNHGDAVAVDMEGLGMYSAAAFTHAVPAVAVRGVSDLLAGKRGVEDAKWQPLAAASAAAFFFEGLATIAPNQLLRTHPEGDIASIW